MIGKLEEIVLLATLRAGTDALPVAVFDQIVSTTPTGGKIPAFGAIYTTLNRMAAKDLLSINTIVDGKCRERRAFNVTAAGQRALQHSMSQVSALGGFAWT